MLFRAFPTGTGEGTLPPEFHLPIGQHGQTLFCKGPDSEEYTPDYTCKFAIVVESEEEFNELVQTDTSMDQIFNTWYRFSHAIDYNYPSNISELQGWELIAETQTIQSTINSGTYIGFISPTAYEDFSIDVTLSSTDSDNDMIGFVIAFLKDTSREYTLTAMRGHGGVGYTWALIYNYNQQDQQVLVDLSYLEPVTGGWVVETDGTRLLCHREGTKISLRTSRFNQTDFDPSMDINFDLDSNPLTKKFTGPCQYGFSCRSQKYSTFRVNSLSSELILVARYDNNSIYINNPLSGWHKDESLSISNGDILGEGRFVYSTYKGRFYYIYNGRLVKINESLSAPDQEIQLTLKAIAAENLLRGSLIAMDSDGKAHLAMEQGKKAVGIVIDDFLVGQEAEIQIIGVFNGYNFSPVPPSKWDIGEIYYQGDHGRPSLQTDKSKYPSVIAISEDSVLILPNTGFGQSGGTSEDKLIGIYVENVGVRRVVRDKTGSTPNLQQIVTFDELMSDAFETDCWQLGLYMIKQYVTIKNTSESINSHLVVQNSTTMEVNEDIPPGIEKSFQIHFTDWKLHVQGEYEVKIVLEIVSNKLPLVVIDTDDISNGYNSVDVFEYGAAKFTSVIMGQIRRFHVYKQKMFSGNDLVIFGFEDWLAATITSPDYMVNCSVSVKNKSNTSTANITTKFSSIDIPPEGTITFELFREDVQLEGSGDIEVDIVCQVTAYSFD